MAEALIERELARRRLAVSVGSAGVRALPDLPAAPQTVEAMRRMGIDIGGHRSRPAGDDLVDAVDLVLTMEGAQALDLIGGRPDRMARVFALKELVQRGGASSGSTRALAPLLDPSGDISDPHGRPLKWHRACARELDALVVQACDLLWPGSAEPSAQLGAP